ncbi:MAG TPA: N-acetylmuramoyl-L-alanine amidase [Solirubrobacteraceae bacterium]|jgi:N-acetylmuramoyl-L-alanine amidase|nr:N-acetylmuramoyl-L-alanine amidase [Solirubrobacteraceae bacterium]
MLARRRLLAAAAALVAIVALSGASGGHAVDPSRFARGSCVAFAADKPLQHLTVYIDAGHGGPDPGAVGVTLRGQPVHEADETLRVVLDAVPLLRAAGFRVVVSRTTAGAVAKPAPGDLVGGLFTGQGVHRDLIARDVCANRSRAAILIGVYFNASSFSATGGSLTLYDSARPFWPASRRLSQIVQRDVLARLRAAGYTVPDDGVHDDVGYGSSVTAADRAYGHLLLLGPAKRGYFSDPTLMPGALIEPLFITNPAEASIAASRRGQEALARGLTEAARDYFRRGS